MIDLSALSKTISHALRHEPWLYELEIDVDGWAPLSQLLESLRLERDEWHALDESAIAEMIRASSKRRHELDNGRIRALYGHSIPAKLNRVPARPPERLFHGTSPRFTDAIAQAGLKPMRRQYVHLSVDEQTARDVGKRKAKEPTLLRIRSLEAFEQGVAFYEGNEQVWLADEVPPQFIAF